MGMCAVVAIDSTAIMISLGGLSALFVCLLILMAFR